MTVRDFLFRKRLAEEHVALPAVSLFAGAGISDLGFELAGFEVLLHAEKNENRATLCSRNFPDAVDPITSDLRETWQVVVQTYRQMRSDDQLALLGITPPCQGMSSSNPSRGTRGNGEKRDRRNRLLLEAIPVIKALRPRTIVVENVPQLLTEPHGSADGEEQILIEAFADELAGYFLFGRVVQMADYGVAQDRRRAIIVAVRADESWPQRLLDAGVGPWPVPTHDREPSNGLLPWMTVEDWFEQMNYPSLDARSEESARDPNDVLHQVPRYEGDYYWRVADIPPRSGRNAYQNSNCRECGRTGVPEGVAVCPHCDTVMHNRPYVLEDDGTVRLVKGRHSSYRRMRHDEPARTITTASSHIGSDYKIHPWENRVLSVRECADLQTVPRFYDWSWAMVETRHTYLTRQVIGEALPPYFTYLQGGLLRRLLNGERVSVESFASFRWAREPK